MAITIGNKIFLTLTDLAIMLSKTRRHLLAVVCQIVTRTHSQLNSSQQNNTYNAFSRSHTTNTGFGNYGNNQSNPFAGNKTSGGYGNSTNNPFRSKGSNFGSSNNVFTKSRPTTFPTSARGTSSNPFSTLTGSKNNAFGRTSSTRNPFQTGTSVSNLTRSSNPYVTTSENNDFVRLYQRLAQDPYGFKKPEANEKYQTSSYSNDWEQALYIKEIDNKFEELKNDSLLKQPITMKMAPKHAPVDLSRPFGSSRNESFEFSNGLSRTRTFSKMQETPSFKDTKRMLDQYTFAKPSKYTKDSLVSYLIIKLV